MYVIFVGFLVSLYVGLQLMQSYGLNPADGYAGELAPFGNRAIFAVTLVGFALLCLIGILAYTRVYVARLWVADDGSHLRIASVGLFGSLISEIGEKEIVSALYRRGYMRDWVSGLTVNAPWVSLWVANRSLPFILDQQGLVHDQALYNRILSTKGIDDEEFQ